MGVEVMIRVLIELELDEYPTDKEVELELHKLVDSREPIWWRVEDDE